MPGSAFQQALVLAGCVWLTRGLDVSVNFFTSTDCKTASTITPSAALNLSTCVVTPGLTSLYYATVPCAGGGIVIPYLFNDNACGTQQTILDFYKTGSDFHCLSDFASDTIASVLLSCNQDHPEQPQATTTVSVGPVATGAAPTSTTSASSGSNGNSDGDQNTNLNGWSSLSLGAHIGIIVGAGVVVLTLCIIGACLLKHRKPPRVLNGPGYYSNGAASRYDSSWKPTHATTPVLLPTYPVAEHPGVSPDAAYIMVLENVVRTARQHAASGYFDNGDIQANNMANPGTILPPGIISAAFARNDEEWKHKLGAAGELYVFEYLRNIGLPAFGLQNWTSSLRTICSAHPEYHGIGPSRDGIADLEYFDEQGAFTEFLLARGYAERGIRRGMRPTYRFEVKATTSVNWRSPFYMSSNQEAHVRNALITSSQPNEVYIICRISSLGSGVQTRLDVYVDPEALRREGQLLFAQTPGIGESSWTVQPR